MGEKDNYVGIKYNILARYTIEGVVERHDVVGAIFGQTEGLFPKEFELRELQRTGKIGRIDIELKTSNDKTTGTISIPSSLDKPETAIIAAAIETVDRIGPCESKISIEEIKDVRQEKLKRIQERAKELLRDWRVRDTQDIEQLIATVSQESRHVEAIHYGRERLAASPDVNQMKELIVVEGRADVISLLRAGISGVIAVEGVKIPRTVRDLAKKKELTAFLDGDRGGDLILREMMQVAKPKYVARAPLGSEVEELDASQIKEALDARVPVEEAKFLIGPPAREERPQPVIAPEPARQVPEVEEIAEAPPVPAGPDFSEYVTLTKELKGNLEAVLLSEDGTVKEKFPVSELVGKVKTAEGVKAIVFDGIVTGRLIDAAAEKGIKILIGERLAEGIRWPPTMNVRAFKAIS